MVLKMDSASVLEKVYTKGFVTDCIQAKLWDSLMGK